MQKITSIDDAIAMIGQQLGVSRWTAIDQHRINQFADVTDDHQWMHTDGERAKTHSPRIHDRARLPDAVTDPVDEQRQLPDRRHDEDQLRAQQDSIPRRGHFGQPDPGPLHTARRDKLSEDIVHLTVNHTVEVDGHARPAAVVETVTRCIF
jgi:acyl dehydratase